MVVIVFLVIDTIVSRTFLITPKSPCFFGSFLRYLSQADGTISLTLCIMMKFVLGVVAATSGICSGSVAMIAMSGLVFFSAIFLLSNLFQEYISMNKQKGSLRQIIRFMSQILEATIILFGLNVLLACEQEYSRLEVLGKKSFLLVSLAGVHVH